MAEVPLPGRRKKKRQTLTCLVRTRMGSYFPVGPQLPSAAAGRAQPVPSATGKCWVGPWFAADAFGHDANATEFAAAGSKKTSAAGSNMKLRVLLLLTPLVVLRELLGQVRTELRSTCRTCQALTTVLGARDV